MAFRLAYRNQHDVRFVSSEVSNPPFSMANSLKYIRQSGFCGIGLGV